MRVWAIPLADIGFIPTDTVGNRVRWYLERLESKDGYSPVIGGAHESKQAAEAYARLQGWEVEN